MGEVQVWETGTQKLKLSVPVTSDTTYGASWSPDSKSLLATVGEAAAAAKDEELIPSFKRLTDETRRTMRLGIRALREVEGARSFFVGVDPFDPADACASLPGNP